MHRRRLVVILLVLGLVTPLVVGPALAETRAGGTVTVAADETVDDLTVFGGTVVIDGTVEGDLTVFAGTVHVNGEVTGSLNAVGGTIDIDGTVGEGIQVAAGTVTIGSDAIVGSISAGGGTITVDGRVWGDVNVGAGTITLGERSVIDGDLVYGGDLERDDGATVHGEVREQTVFVWRSVWDVGLFDWISTIVFLVMHLILGAMLLVIAPRFSRSVAESVRRDPLRNGVYGLATIVLVPLVLIGLMITIVAIPLALAGVLLFLVLYWVGLVYGRYAVGEWLLALADVDERWLALVVGVVVIGVVAQVPWIGGLISLAVTLLGLGALLESLWARRERVAGDG
ncbi:MAG: bactofilin family protein [Halobacteriota archaeon]